VRCESELEHGRLLLSVSPLMSTTRHVATFCPACNSELNASTGLRPTTVPEPDDATFCAYCATLLRFTPELTLRRWSKAEWFEAGLLERVELTRIRRRMSITRLVYVDWRFETPADPT
jgi:hypothetical protein